jgi:hypothetical protein
LYGASGTVMYGYGQVHFRVRGLWCGFVGSCGFLDFRGQREVSIIHTERVVAVQQRDAMGGISHIGPGLLIIYNGVRVLYSRLYEGVYK